MSYWTYEEIKKSRVSFIVKMSKETPPELANKLGVSERTFYRYLGKEFVGNKLPILMAAGQLGAIDLAWEDWRLIKGKLMHPSGISVYPSEIKQMDWFNNLIFNSMGRWCAYPWKIKRVSANDEIRVKTAKIINFDDNKGSLAGGELVSNQPG